VNKKGRCVAIKTQQSNSLCRAVKPPPFDKGGKGVGDFRGIVRFWKVMWGSGAKFEQKTQVLQKRLKTEGGERILESGWQY